MALKTNFKYFEVKEPADGKPYVQGDIYAELLEQLRRIADALEEANQLKTQTPEVQ